MGRALGQLRVYSAVAALCLSCNARKYVQDFQATAPDMSEEFVSPEQVTAGNEANYAPELSPNGEYVIFVSERSGNKDLWEKRAVGGGLRPITTHTADDFAPVMSNEGRRVAFVTRRTDAAGNIAIMKVAGLRMGLGGQRNESPLDEIIIEEAEESQPAWFPGEEKLVFVSRRPGEIVGRLMKSDIYERQSAAIFDWRGASPSVSPDGAKLVFARDGALFLGDLTSGDLRQLTLGGTIKDGQPRFSSDGRSIVFTRYGEDSNRDGDIDDKDRSSIWLLSLAAGEGQNIMRAAYDAVRLTTARHSANFPDLRPPFVYFTMQQKGNLDVYRLPEDGPIKTAGALADVYRAFDAEPDLANKHYILQKAMGLACSRRDDDSCGELALRELRWLVQEGRTVDGRLAAERIRAAFPTSGTLVALADLATIDLDIAKWGLLKQKAEPDQASQERLQRAEEEIEAISKRLGIEHDRFDGQAMLVKARAMASRRDIVGAMQELRALLKRYPKRRWLSAEASWFHARLVKFAADGEQMITALRSVVKDFPEDAEVVRRAAEDIVEEVNSRTEDRDERLASTRDSNKDLPILSMLAHRAIAKEFLKAKKSTVAINEMRLIVDQYPNEDDIRLEVAQELSVLMEAAGQRDDLDKTLSALVASISGAKSPQRVRARKLLIDMNIRWGEDYLRQNEPGQAMKLYRKVLAIDPDNVPANRGLIDSAFRRKTLDELLPSIQKRADDEPENAAALYFHAYALTYKIDVASDVLDKLKATEDAISLAERARDFDGKILQIHQTLGWLYVQRDALLRKYYENGGVRGNLAKRWSLVRDFLGTGEANGLEQAIDSYLLAYSLADERSLDQANLDLNLGNAYYELKNFGKALEYYLKRIRILSSVPMRDKVSEGTVLRNAGRCAFNTDDLDLAQKLQKRSLRHWEGLDRQEDVAYSLDALALTERELGHFAEALKYYERLLRIHERRGDMGNRAQTLVNIGFTQYSNKQYDTALQSMDMAESALDGLGGKAAERKGEEKKKEGEAIKVDLAGQDSAAKGFDTFMQRDLIVSVRSKIQEERGHFGSSFAQDFRKLRILSEADEARRKSKVRLLAEEKSIVLNNLGVREAEEGRHKAAIVYFQQAAVESKPLCREGGKVLCREVAISQLNIMSIQLRRAKIGTLSRSERSGAMELIKESLGEIADRVASGSRIDTEHDGKLRRIRVGLIATDSARSLEDKQIAVEDTKVLNTLLESDAISDGEKQEITDTIGVEDKGGSEARSLAELDKSLARVPRGLNLSERVAALHTLMAKSPPSFADLSRWDRIRLRETASRLQIGELLAELNIADAPRVPHEVEYRYLLRTPADELWIGSEGKVRKVSGRSLEELAHAVASALSIASTTKRIYLIPLNDVLSVAQMVREDLLKSNKEVAVALCPSATLIEVFEGSPRINRVTAGVVSDYGKIDADMLIIPGRVRLNDSESSRSRLLDARDGRIASESAFSVFSGSRESKIWGGVSYVFFGGLEREDPALSGLGEGWVGLNLLMVHGGAASQVLRLSASGPTVEQLSTKFRSMPVRDAMRSAEGWIIVGHPGMTGAEEVVFAKQQLEKELELAKQDEEAEDWPKATLTWRRVAFLFDVSTQGKVTSDDQDRREGIAKSGLVSSLKARDFQAALLFQQRITLSRRSQGQTSEPFLKARLEEAKIAVKAGDYATSDPILSELQVYRESQSDWIEAGRVSQYLAISLQSQQKYEAAAKVLEVSRMHFKKGEDSKEAALRSVDLANLHKDALSDPEAALELYDHALVELSELDEKDTIVAVQLDRANTLLDLGLVQEAITALEPLPEKLAAENFRTRVKVKQVLSNAWFRAGGFQKAQALNGEVLKELESIKEVEPKAVARIDALNLQGYLAAKLGDTRRGLTVFEEALRVAERFKLPVKEATLYNNIGYWQREEGDVDASIVSFDKAKQIDLTLKSKLGLAFDLRNIGLSLILKGNFADARESLSEALRLSQETKALYNEAYCHFGLGELEKRTGKLDAAAIAFQQATRIAEKASLMDFVWKGYAAQASVARDKGDSQSAAHLYEKAVSIIEGLRAGLQSISSRSGFQGDRGVQDVYQALVSVLMKIGEVEKAWTFSERSRARAFIDSIGSQTYQIGQDSDGALLKIESERRSQVDLLQRKLLRAPSSSAESIKAQLDLAIAAYQSTLAKLRESKAGAIQFVSVEVATPPEVGKILGKGNLLLEYMVTADELFIWALLDGVVKGYAVPINATKLIGTIETARNLVQSYSSLEYAQKELSQILIAPVVAELQRSNRVVIVPHGPLHYLPFGILIMDEKLLVERFPITYLESATLARFLERGRNNSASRIVAIGNPAVGKDLDLPFAEKEVGVISRYFDNVQPFVGPAATAEALWKFGPSASILHIASHGEFNEANPSQSKLRLVGRNDSSKKDRVLTGLSSGDVTVQDILTLRLSASLVTLSACETGLGKVASGDEVVGMNRAFIFAGANSLMSSLWRISDVASAVTVKRMYRSMSEGKGPAESLQSAQLLVRKYYPHPAYWAAFKVVGLP